MNMDEHNLLDLDSLYAYVIRGLQQSSKILVATEGKDGDERREVLRHVLYQVAQEFLKILDENADLLRKQRYEPTFWEKVKRIRQAREHFARHHRR